MPKAYSQDLRERVIATIKAGQQSQAKIAETFGVSQATVENWWQRWRTAGSCAALPHGGGQTRRLADCQGVIRAALKRQPDLTLAELIDHVDTECGVRVSSSMMARELKRLDLPRKKSRSTIVNGTRRG